MKRLFLSASVLLICLAADANAASISLIAPNPRATTPEIGATLRWGGRPSEAALMDMDPRLLVGALNPALGWPGWEGDQSPYAFELLFTSATGMLTLNVDFTRDGFFDDPHETVSETIFSVPGPTGYAGYGFSYISFRVINNRDEFGGVRSVIGNLKINGTDLGVLSPSLNAHGHSKHVFFGDLDGPMGDVQITGELAILSHGSGDPKAMPRPAATPRWMIMFRNAEPVIGTTAVPVPDGGTTLLLLGAALVGLGALRRQI
jgi:hypothetical protein